MVFVCLAGVLAFGCAQTNGSDTMGGARAFKHEGRWFIATCEQVKDDVLGDDLGTVPFEDTSLGLRRLNGVGRDAALAIEWEECGSSWTLATAGELGDAPNVEPFRRVLQ